MDYRNTTRSIARQNPDGGKNFFGGRWNRTHAPFVAKNKKLHIETLTKQKQKISVKSHTPITRYEHKKVLKSIEKVRK